MKRIYYEQNQKAQQIMRLNVLMQSCFGLFFPFTGQQHGKQGKYFQQ